MRVLGARSLLPVSGPRDVRISAIAAAQRGRVSDRQLLAAGISRSTIHRLVQRGALIAVHRGVLAVGHVAPVELAAETAALLAVRDGALLSHHSSARLWNLRTEPDGLIHLTVTGGPARAPRGVRVHRTSILTPRDVRIRSGLPVTSPAPTLLDLAELLTPRRLELAFDQALVSKIMTLTDVDELLRRVRGRAGVPSLRALADRERGQGPTLTRSQAEEIFLGLIREADLPEPEVNAHIHGYEVDFLWRHHNLVVEIDGFRYHSTARVFEHDRRKDNALRGHGLDTLRFTWRDLERRQLMTVATVARGLSR